MNIASLREPSAERREFENWHPHETYLHLPKGFGDVPSEQLETLALQLETSDRPEHLLAAGSAIIEATIFAPDRSAETHNKDLLMIEYATLLLEESANRYWLDLERGFNHPDDQTAALRANIQAAYSGIYRNMITGGILEQNRQETYAEVAKIGRYSHYLTKHMRSRYKSEAAGLTFEIATLMGGLTDDGVLLPSTPRAGSGRYNPESTYDFSYVELSDNGSIKSNVAIEFKNERKLDRRLKAAGRYTSTLVHAGEDLQLHKGQLPHIFGHQTLTPSARRELANVRAGLYTRVREVPRKRGKIALSNSARINAHPLFARMQGAS